MTTTTDTAPQTFTIYARDMLTSQAVTITGEHRADLVNRANRIRQIISAAQGFLCTDKQTMNVPVVDAYDRCTVIGYLTFTL